MRKHKNDGISESEYAKLIVNANDIGVKKNNRWGGIFLWEKIQETYNW